MTQKFLNIASAEINKVNKSAAENIAELQTLASVDEILNKWYFKDLMTAGAKKKTWVLSDLVTYITDRINKNTKTKKAAIVDRIDTVGNAGLKKVDSISISVEWVKNRTWGACPIAEIRIAFDDNTCNYYKSGRITGCGYDKESTAIAQALNQCNYLLYLMYDKKDKNIDKENREIFGYGSGYGVKPYFEGGVGVSCYPDIFESIGYKWESVSHGKTFDVYKVTKA